MHRINLTCAASMAATSRTIGAPIYNDTRKRNMARLITDGCLNVDGKKTERVAAAQVGGNRYGTSDRGLSCATVYHSHVSWSTDLTKPMRRPVAGMDKEFRCNYGDCDKAFYDRHNLLRHQTLKHGRKPDVYRSWTTFGNVGTRPGNNH
ncbi:hypothetical protein LSAT2_021701 [Lamellibrachia satsuma]|nr:hypothetical protein LSAT2_021701 [Lamellibrachia satsuma]